MKKDWNGCDYIYYYSKTLTPKKERLIKVKVPNLVIKTIKKKKEIKIVKAKSILLPLEKKFIEYKRRITKKNKSFTLTYEEFSLYFSMSCTYCGSIGNISIDRINSDIGYTLKNTQPCCIKCNMMKYTNTQEDFLQHISKIYKYACKSIS